MFKLIRKDYWIADSALDLENLSAREKDFGAICYVIDEACEYRLKSDGEWAKQVSTTSSFNSEVDLSGYATEEYVDAAAANSTTSAVNTAKQYADAKAREVSNKIPSIAGLATEAEVEEVASNPILKAFEFSHNPSKEDGQAIYLTADDDTTLAQAMQEKGLGLYNIWLAKTRSDLPASMIANNTSGRGFACVDLQTKVEPEKFIGYVVLFDKKNNMYYKFFNKGTEGPWMHVTAVED